MSNPGCVVARSFPSHWPLASTTTEKFDGRVRLGLRSCSSEGCTTYRQVKLPSCRCISMFPGSLSRRISCMQTLPGRGLPHDRGPARSAMRCSYPLELVTVAEFNGSTTTTSELKIDGYFLRSSSLYLSVSRYLDEHGFFLADCRQCGLQANNEEEIAWCSGGTATPRRLALWARRPRFSTSIDWDTPGSLLSDPDSSSPSRWTTNWKKLLVEYATVAYLVVHSPS